MPMPESLAKECQKAARTLRSFTMPDAQSGPDKIIPPHIIETARGLVIMTVVKAGFFFSLRGGFGLVVARLQDGSWSAPSAVGTGAFGAGLQFGAELTDFVIILNSQRAVEAFTYSGNVSIGAVKPRTQSGRSACVLTVSERARGGMTGRAAGGNMSVAAGPVGRNAEASGTANLAPLLAYSKTRGLFVGISLEGSVFVERSDANATFYGKPVRRETRQAIGRTQARGRTKTRGETTKARGKRRRHGGKDEGAGHLERAEHGALGES